MKSEKKKPRSAKTTAVKLITTGIDFLNNILADLISFLEIQR